MALADVNDGGTPYMAFLLEEHAVHTLTSARARPSTRFIRFALLHSTRLGRMSLKKCVFLVVRER